MVLWSNGIAHVGSARDLGWKRDGKDTMAKLCKPGMTNALVSITSPGWTTGRRTPKKSPKRGGKPPNSSRLDLLNKDLILAVTGTHQCHPVMITQAQHSPGSALGTKSRME